MMEGHLKKRKMRYSQKNKLSRETSGSCKFKVLILCVTFIPFLAFAKGEYTRVDSTKLYSEYYPNPKASFKGTIIFQNGAGTELGEWTKNNAFFQCVKKYGDLFLYDRSGLGNSPPDLSMTVDKPMTAELINSKLEKLLKRRGCKPPYIFVAHSYGAMYAGHFARKYPGLVKAILMVDPVPSNYEWSDDFLNQYKKDITRMKQLTSKQAYEEFTYLKREQESTMPAQLFYQIMGFEKTKLQIRELPLMINKIPIIIVSSSYMEKNAPVKGDWYQLQRQWLNKNPQSEIIQVKSSHFIQLDHTELICKQIGKLLNKE